MLITHGGSEAMSSSSVAARHTGTHQRGLACFVHAVNGKDVLCQIDANGYDCHGLPLPTNE